jgi:deaminated glutathione amidase
VTATVKIALIQTNSGRDVAPNLAAVGEQVRQAAGAGARFVLTPENVAMLEPVRAQALGKAAPEASHAAIPFFADLARALGIHLLAGSFAIKREDGLLANRSYLFDDKGRVAARYSKIHMFDVDLPNGERYRESSSFAPGEAAVLAPSPFGPIGLTICYDLRFPHLYRALAQAGAAILTVPSAFTVVTGEAHWHVLLRARAIETGCFVLAPAQTGTHAEGRRTYGHSLAVAPWGEILGDAGTDTGILYADLDLARIADARARVPSLQHDRPFAPPLPVEEKSAAE